MGNRPILIVDDEPDVRDIFRTVLEHYGYPVREAGDGPEALRKAAAEPPAMVLLDVGLPGMDGWEVNRRLKEDPATRDIPVLIVTAALIDEALARAEREGCAGYLLKPVVPSELVQEVQACIASEEAPADA